MDYDDDQDCMPYQKIFRTTTPTARKVHQCDTCEGAIKPGQKYYCVVGVFDDGFKVYRDHLDEAECAAGKREALEEHKHFHEQLMAYWNSIE